MLVLYALRHCKQAEVQEVHIQAANVYMSLANGIVCLAQDSIGNPKGNNAFFAWNGMPKYGQSRPSASTCSITTA